MNVHAKDGLGAAGRLRRHWVEGGFLAGLLMLVLLPAFAIGWPAPLTATFLQLPVYMLHQFEEHDGDRFRRFVNDRLAGGREALTPLAVFVINVPGVWGVIAAATLLCAFVHPGFGLVAVWGVIVNAAVHVLALIALGRPNPGVWTALVLFLPAGAAGLLAFRGVAGPAWHVFAALVALAIHAAIVVHVRRRIGALTATT